MNFLTIINVIDHEGGQTVSYVEREKGEETR